MEIIQFPLAEMQQEEELFSYLAGNIDCDGTITLVKRSDSISHMPMVAFTQTKQKIPNLFLETFGGYHYRSEKKPPWSGIYHWSATKALAEVVCRTLCPYLYLKRRQAEIVLQYAEKNSESRCMTYGFWYQREHPNWRNEPLITVKEAQSILGYLRLGTVYNLITKGHLLALPMPKPRKNNYPRLPKSLVLYLAELRSESPTGHLCRVPPKLIELRQRLTEKIQALNKRGTSGDPNTKEVNWKQHVSPYPYKKELLYSYLAGCIDSDGTISLIATGDGVYTPCVAFSQTNSKIVNLLHNTFGGYRQRVRKKAPHRDTYAWRATKDDGQYACEALLPYLRLKKQQAELVLHFCQINDNPVYKKYGYWYEIDNPNWRKEELVTTYEAKELLNYNCWTSVHDNIEAGHLLALPVRRGTANQRRIPKKLILQLVERKSNCKGGRLSPIPLQLQEMRLEIVRDIRKLNKRGVPVPTS